ncbi:MAG: macrolide ABC transporter ATP-binding protein [Phycisphaeraceae bacterium]|nr:macrolide ABC transporter ATP-binding protein [Phycisphaeraceae bacterium]
MGAETSVRALRGVTHQFERGSFWSVMGPSGSGKSTLLHLIGCLDRPTGGRCLIDGHDLATLDDARLSDLRLRRLGFIFQSFNLIPQLTVEENIQLPLFYLGWEARRSHERARELAAMVDLGDRLGHRPAELSGGQQQRAAIARALANDPAVILADEPTGNLDSATGRQILELITKLNAEGRTVIMVTHDPTVAERSPARLHLRDGLVERVETAN